VKFAIILKMKRVARKFRNLKEAEEREIEEQVSLSLEERQQIAKALKEKIYGKNPPDVRVWERRKR